MCPALGSVVHHPQAASAAQPRHVRHAELRADVASAEEDLDVGRRVSAERDAAQHAWYRLDERQSSISAAVAVFRMSTVRLAMIDLRAVVVDQNDVTYSRCSKYQSVDGHWRSKPTPASSI